MNQLKRIRESIGTFVSGDFKRKRLATETEEEDDLNGNSPMTKYKMLDTTDSLSEPAFLRRVSTFTKHIWCRDIPALSPLEISRHGWAATEDEFMVTCANCHEYLSLVIPPPYSGTRDSCIQTAVERLSSAHGEFCPWSACRNPLAWTRVQVPDLEDVAYTAVKISSLGVRLPFIRPEVCKDWENVVRKLDNNVLSKIEDPQVRQMSCVLALCGWKDCQVEDTLQDNYSTRKVGCWLFVSIQDEEDILETQRVALEFEKPIEDPRSLIPEGKEYFDPIKEHLSWHPLVQKKDGVHGWRYVLTKLSRDMTEDPRDVKTKRDPMKAIKKVRDILNQK